MIVSVKIFLACLVNLLTLIRKVTYSSPYVVQVVLQLHPPPIYILLALHKKNFVPYPLVTDCIVRVPSIVNIKNEVTAFFRGDCCSWNRTLKILVYFPKYLILVENCRFFCLPSLNIVWMNILNQNKTFNDKAIANFRCFIDIFIRLLVLLVFLMLCGYLST